MTYQEKMKWLGRYQAALSYQHMLEDEIEVLRSDAERVTTCMSGMPGRGGPNVDRLPRAVERIEKAQKKLAQPLPQQADAAAHAKSPQAVQPQGRVRPDAPHPARIFLCCHFHIVSPPGISFP